MDEQRVHTLNSLRPEHEVFEAWLRSKGDRGIEKERCPCPF
jgi:hypothetical protein